MQSVVRVINQAHGGATLRLAFIGARNPHADTTEDSTGDSAPALDDSLGAFNPSERIGGKTITRGRP